jgi:hypothetical protein
MNVMQKRRAAEAANEPSAPAGAGHWIAGGRLSFAGMIWPRGAVLPDEIVASIAPYRLSVLVTNKLVLHRLGEPPADAPRPVKIAQSDPKAEHAAMLENMARDGYQPHELDAKVRPPPGAYRPRHPAASIVAGDPVSTTRRP